MLAFLGYHPERTADSSQTVKLSLKPVHPKCDRTLYCSFCLLFPDGPLTVIDAFLTGLVSSNIMNSLHAFHFSILIASDWNVPLSVITRVPALFGQFSVSVIATADYKFVSVQSAFHLTAPTLHEGLHFPNFMQVRAQVRSSIRLYTFRQRDKTGRLLRTYWNLHDRRFAWNHGLRWIYLYILCYSKNEN